MVTTDDAGSDVARKPETLPFCAPCRTLRPTAPLRWLRLGWRDLRAAPLESLSYGLLLTLLGALIALGTWKMGLMALYLGLASGFVFIGPFLAVGLYSISYQLQIGRKPTLWFSLHEGRAHLSDTLVLGICLLVVLLLWGRAATILNVFRPIDAFPTWHELIPFLGIGSAVGALFCTIIFAATAFSLPMLLERRADAITAVITSVNATLRNKAAMLVWGAIIVAAMLVGFATGLLAFIVLLPLLGHATWHAYREAIDASAWPETHEPETR